MRKVAEITEQFQHFVRDLQESFWGDLNGKAQAAMKRLLEEQSRRQRDRYLCRDAYERKAERKDYRNGCYSRCLTYVFNPFIVANRRRINRGDTYGKMNFYETNQESQAIYN